MAPNEPQLSGSKHPPPELATTVTDARAQRDSAAHLGAQAGVRFSVLRPNLAPVREITATGNPRAELRSVEMPPTFSPPGLQARPPVSLSHPTFLPSLPRYRFHSRSSSWLGEPRPPPAQLRGDPSGVCPGTRHRAVPPRRGSNTVCFNPPRPSAWTRHRRGTSPVGGGRPRVPPREPAPGLSNAPRSPSWWETAELAWLRAVLETCPQQRRSVVLPGPCAGQGEGSPGALGRTLPQVDSPHADLDPEAPGQGGCVPQAAAGRVRPPARGAPSGSQSLVPRRQGHRHQRPRQEPP